MIELIDRFRLFYILGSIINMYVLFRFAELFFNERKFKLRYIIAAFVAYFTIELLLNIYVNNGLINIISNLVLFFMILNLYEGKIIKKVYITFFIIVLEILIDIFTSLIFAYILEVQDLTKLNIVVAFVSILLVLLIERIVRRNSLHEFNQTGIILIIVPLLSVILISYIMIKGFNLLFISAVIMFIINLLLIHYYEWLQRIYENDIENIQLKSQIESYNNQFDIINETNNRSKAARHDFNNHLITLNALLEQDISEASKYITKILKESTSSKQYVNTGNQEFDSIINYKLHVMSKYTDNINIKISIPEKTNFDLYDISTLLGNLFDNAIKALSETQNGIFNLKIVYEKDTLIINSTNNYNRINKDYSTTKNDQDFHGQGLQIISKIAEKYDGMFNYGVNNNHFFNEIIIFNPDK